MAKKIKQFQKGKPPRINFKEIDSKILMGWECIEAAGEQKRFLEKLKSQTIFLM